MATDRKCTYRRCNNGTVRLVSGMDVDCQRCSGTGRIPSAADCKSADAAETRRYQLLRTLDAAARKILGRDANHMTVLEYVQEARTHLHEHAPERYALMLDAVENGRTDQVITWLRQYAMQHIYTNNGSA